MPSNGARTRVSSSCSCALESRALASARAPSALVTSTSRSPGPGRRRRRPAASRSERSAFRRASSSAVSALRTADRADRYVVPHGGVVEPREQLPPLHPLARVGVGSQHRAADLRPDGGRLLRLERAGDGRSAPQLRQASRPRCSRGRRSRSPRRSRWRSRRRRRPHAGQEGRAVRGREEIGSRLHGPTCSSLCRAGENARRLRPGAV